MDFVVASVEDKNWFYCMSQTDICWDDSHVDVVFYYLRKKSKMMGNNDYTYTTSTCIFRDKVNEIFDRYKDELDTSLFTDDDPISHYIMGMCVPAGLTWDMVDDIFIPVNCKEKLHWVLAVVSLRNRSISIYDSMRDTGKQHRTSILAAIEKIALILPHFLKVTGFLQKNERCQWNEIAAYRDRSENDPFAVVYEENVPQQKPGSLDCGVFVAAYVEILNNRLPIQPLFIDVDQYRIRYASLLWNYAVKKFADGYISPNEDILRPKHAFDAADINTAVDLD